MKGKDRSEAGIERTFDEGGRREDRRNGGREGSLLGKSRRGTEAARVWRGRCEFGGDWKRKFLSFPLRFGRFVLERNISLLPQLHFSATGEFRFYNVGKAENISKSVFI